MSAEGAAKPLALVVAGPTASGKSALAVRIAEEVGGTIINADSLQVYRELAILTARPGKEDVDRVPHRLYGVLSVTENCSAGRWRQMALTEMERARGEGRLPILVGGTGLYLKALEEGLYEIPAVPTAVRAEAEALLASGERDRLRQDLAEGDPESHARLHPNDTQRLLRAWEVLQATGRPLSEWQRRPALPAAPWRFAWILLLPPREVLAREIDRRFQAMLEAGALEEVRLLMDFDLAQSSTAAKAVGVPDLAAYMRGEVDLDSATRAAQAATRRYAKRQLTWLRGQVLGRKETILLIRAQYSDLNSRRIFPKVLQFVLTLSG